jgi:hypothetical protein
LSAEHAAFAADLAAAEAEAAARARKDAVQLAAMRAEATRAEESGYTDRLAALKAKGEATRKRLAQAKEERAAAAAKRARTTTDDGANGSAVPATAGAAATSAASSSVDNPFLDWRAAGSAADRDATDSHASHMHA